MKKMSQELMNYDKGRRRWRAMYKGKRLSVKVSDLGGTGRDDTLVAANRWYRQQVEEIDSQQIDSEAIFRPNEAEYLQNMESLFSSISALKTLKDKNLEPLIKILKDRLDKTKEYLSKKSLPPLPDDLKNPLNIGEKAVAEKADAESVEDNLRYRMWIYENEKDNEGWLEGEGLYHISRFLDDDGFVDEEAFENEFDDGLPEHLTTENEKKRYVQKRIG